jgi:hypothetical protein
MKFLLGLILILPSAYAASIKDYEHYNYDVFFTNPICKGYEFDETVYSFDGKPLSAKPENVYCKYSDAKKNQKRKSSPHYNIKKLISDESVKELRMAYLSFSSSDIIKTLCKETIAKNNTKLSLIVDKGNKADEKKMAKIEQLLACKPAQKYIDAGIANYPTVEFRGQVGGLGYAHNKIIMATYKKASDKVTIVFSSANMSSGTVLHHENWHFLTTSSKSYLAQAHVCILDGMKDHAVSVRSNRSLGRKKMSAINNFKSYIKKCRANITTEEESDIKLSIVPSDGDKAMSNIVEQIGKAKKVSVAVHRFSHKSLISALKKAGKNKKQEVRFVADDDIYWSGKANEMSNGRIDCNPNRNPGAVPRVGANMCNEYFNVISLSRSKVDVKYMETNQSLFLLHHNKYIVFEYADGSGALHCGAGNFTKAAFSKNFENYYFITIPEVVEQFKAQYNHVWNDLATSEKDLPVAQVLP